MKNDSEFCFLDELKIREPIMIDWLTSLSLVSSFLLVVSFSFCFCFKRDRATYSVSSTRGTLSPKVAVNLVPLPPVNESTGTSVESDYEKIIGSSGDGEIHVNHDYRGSNGSMEYGGYTKLTPIRNQERNSSVDNDDDDDETQLYATVDKNRHVNNSSLRLTNNTTAAVAAAIRQGSSPASTTAYVDHDN